MSLPGFDAGNFSKHPQSPYLYLEPGQSQPYRVTYEIPDQRPGRTGWLMGDRIDSSISVFLQVQASPSANFGQEFSITLPTVIDVVRSPGGDASQPAPNATIQGTARAAETGLPLANTDLELFGGLNLDPGPYRTRTDANGEFTTEVYAYQRSGGFPSWREISIRRAGRGQDSPDSLPVVIPRAGETTAADVTLPATDASLNYEVIGTLDLGLDAYASDASASGNTVATVPFHLETLPASTKEAKSKLSVFTATGEVLWQLPIRGQTPAVDVSDDGTLIASTRQTPDPTTFDSGGGTAIVLDRAGRLLLEVPPVSTNDSGWGGDERSPFMEVRLSHDNRYLAVGDNSGRVLMVEVATGRQLWRTFVKEQVRRIDFDLHDERVLVSGGDGWLRAYSMSGALLWQSWVDSWVTAMDVSARYVLAIGKPHRGGLHLIDKVTGVERWAYQTDYTANHVRIAPDESYVYATSGGPNTHTVFTIDGLPFMRLGGRANAVAISGDGQLLAYSDGCALFVVDRKWKSLFKSGYLADPSGCIGNFNYLVAMTPDASSIVVAAGERQDYPGRLYFFKRVSAASSRPASGR